MSYDNNIMIKILMVIGNPERGGAQTFAVNVLKNIDRNNFQIDFVFMSNRTDGYYNEIKSLGSTIYQLPKYNFINKKSFKNSWHKLFGEHKYNIVHAHATGPAHIFLKIARQYGIATISHSHSASYRGSVLEKLAKKASVRKVRKFSDYWFACSDLAAKRLYGKKYQQYSNYYYIPNMIDPDRFKYDGTVAKETKRELKISDNNRVYGHLGSFSKPKNHAFLLNSFKKILVNNPNSTLLLVGDGPLRPEIENTIAKLDMAKNVILVGSVADTHKYLFSMDVMIFPSLFEGFPISVLEAQAAGVVVIASDRITKEVCLTDHIYYHSLSEGASNWADFASSVPLVTDRSKSNFVISQTKYNIENGIKNLESIYNRIVKKDSNE